MKALATLVMRGRLQAIMMTSLFGVLSLIFPPLSYVSGGILALVTLRKGANEGIVLTLVATLIMAVLSVIATGHYIVAVVYFGAVWLPLLALSLVLRATVSMPLALSAAAFIGVIAVVGFHGAVGDPVAWWKQLLDTVLGEAVLPAQLPEGVTSMEEVADALARTMTALMASAFVLGLIFSLFIGRWWQAALYNPGGFKDEFRALRLDKTTAVIAIALIAWSMMSAGLGSMAADLAAVVVSTAGVVGLALVHDWAARTGAHVAWLVGIYILMAIAMPQLMAAMAIAAILDAFLDLRRYFKPRGGSIT